MTFTDEDIKWLKAINKTLPDRDFSEALTRENVEALLERLEAAEKDRDVWISIADWVDPKSIPEHQEWCKVAGK